MMLHFTRHGGIIGLILFRLPRHGPFHSWLTLAIHCKLEICAKRIWFSSTVQFREWKRNSGDLLSLMMQKNGIEIRVDKIQVAYGIGGVCIWAITTTTFVAYQEKLIHTILMSLSFFMWHSANQLGIFLLGICFKLRVVVPKSEKAEFSTTH